MAFDNMQSCTMRVLATALPMLGLAPAIDAQTIWLVPEDQATIQGAIDVAAPGDTVLVSPGVYAENIDFTGKDITLRSVRGARPTVIDGGQVRSVARFRSGESAAAVLDGFTLRNGANVYQGAGVRCIGASPTIVNCIIRDNEAGGDGGGIYNESGSPVIANCVIAHNRTVYWNGGGVMTLNGNAVITNCTVVDNRIPSDGWGSGIYAQGGSTLISNCIVRDNVGDPPVFALNAVVQHSNYEGAPNSDGNFDADPRFVNAGLGDFHLRWDSPCRNAGKNGVPGSTALDMEGNRRIREGVVDVGADEYGPHFYCAGEAVPGATLHFTLVGVRPGARASAVLTTNVLAVPLHTPRGPWFLADRRVELFADLAAGGDELLVVPFQVPSTAVVPLTLYAQGVDGGRFTDLETVLVE